MPCRKKDLGDEIFVNQVKYSHLAKLVIGVPEKQSDDGKTLVYIEYESTRKRAWVMKESVTFINVHDDGNNKQDKKTRSMRLKQEQEDGSSTVINQKDARNGKKRKANTEKTCNPVLDNNTKRPKRGRQTNKMRKIYREVQEGDYVRYNDQLYRVVGESIFFRPKQGRSLPRLVQLARCYLPGEQHRCAEQFYIDAKRIVKKNGIALIADNNSVEGSFTTEKRCKEDAAPCNDSSSNEHKMPAKVETRNGQTQPDNKGPVDDLANDDVVPLTKRVKHEETYAIDQDIQAAHASSSCNDNISPFSADVENVFDHPSYPGPAQGTLDGAIAGCFEAARSWKRHATMKELYEVVFRSLNIPDLVTDKNCRRWLKKYVKRSIVAIKQEYEAE